MPKIKYFIEYTVVLLTGGLVYMLCELMWRGYSHWTMAVAGGVSLVLIYIADEKFPDRTLLLQCVEGCLTITAIEFIIGYTVNIQLGWNVWDYNDIPLNIMGQVCLPFMILWFVLTVPAILLCRLLRFKLFRRNQIVDRGVLFNVRAKKKLR